MIATVRLTDTEPIRGELHELCAVGGCASSASTWATLRVDNLGPSDLELLVPLCDEDVEAVRLALSDDIARGLLEHYTPPAES